jgi:hypothetical protein
MTEAKAHGARAQTGRTGSSRPDPNHPLPLRPMAHVRPETAEVSATEANETAGAEPDDAVVQLAGALRTAERAHGAYLAELRLGDVEPAEDWSTWYAEFLLGLR